MAESFANGYKTISNLMKMAESFANGYKTFWEKEKLLVASNFSFSHNVFKRLVLQTHKNQGLFGKGLNFTQNIKFAFQKVANIMGKGENAGYQHFLIFLHFLQCFQKASTSGSFEIGIVCLRVNPLPDMLILVSSNSAANKDRVSKIWTNGGTII